MVWARKTKVFPQKYNSTSKALPNGKCSVLNTCIYFIVVLFYSTGQSSSLNAVFYSISLRSLYVNQGLKKTTHAFSIRTTVEKKNYISAASYAWASIVFHCLCEIIIQNWIRFNSSGNFKRVLFYCSSCLRSERRLKDRQECSKVGQNDQFETSFSFKTWHKTSLSNIHSKPYQGEKFILQISPHTIFSLIWTKFRKRKRLNPLFVTCQNMLSLFRQCLLYKSHMITTTKHKYKARKL